MEATTIALTRKALDFAFNSLVDEVLSTFGVLVGCSDLRLLRLLLLLHLYILLLVRSKVSRRSKILRLVEVSKVRSILVN